MSSTEGYVYNAHLGEAGCFQLRKGKWTEIVLYAEEIIEYQGHFWRQRSTVDQISTLIQILEKCWEQNIDVHPVLIDFQAAYVYDSAWRKEI
jgi:hypothetical protein